MLGSMMALLRVELLMAARKCSAWARVSKVQLTLRTPPHEHCSFARRSWMPLTMSNEKCSLAQNAASSISPSSPTSTAVPSSASTISSSASAVTRASSEGAFHSWHFVRHLRADAVVPFTLSVMLGLTLWAAMRWSWA